MVKILITPNDKKRLSLLKFADKNPSSILLILNQIHKLAKDALQGTLDAAKPSLLKDVSSSFEAILQRFEKKSSEMHDAKAKKFLNDLDRKLRVGIAGIKPRKGDPGDPGDPGAMPSDDDIRRVLVPFMDEMRINVTPSVDTLRTLVGSVATELLLNMQPTLEQQAEQEKILNDKIIGIARDVIGGDISKIKRFGGGGATGANAQLISNITVEGTGDRLLSGAINGINASFSTKRSFKIDSERIFLNGVRMRKGASNDYTVTDSKTFVFNFAPDTGDSIVVDIDAGF